MSVTYTRGEMLEYLRNGVCEVSFIKKNGETLNMVPDLIPFRRHSKERGPRGCCRKSKFRPQRPQRWPPTV